MKVTYQTCCGVDVHKSFLVATIVKTSGGIEPSYQKKRFSTFNNSILEFKQWLLDNDCHDVCMESTGKYWVPVFNLLEDEINVVIANPKWVKAVKGNKDDTKDSKWIGDLFRLGLVKGSYIPCKIVRILREYTRYRYKLVSCRSSEKNRSAAGWLYTTIERTKEVAELTAAVTHNHPERIKGAVATACCIFLARNGASKDEIRRYVEKEFHYDLSRSLDDIRPTYHHVESCQQTVPEAITAFLEAEDFEDSIRNAVSLGGDTDTLAAITGSISEAFFGIPEALKAECRNRIDAEMLRVLDAFDEALGR